MTIIEGVYCIIREVDLPPGVHGVVRIDGDGVANIYLSLRDSDEEKKKTIKHEVNHVRFGHVASGLDVREMEQEAQ